MGAPVARPPTIDGDLSDAAWRDAVQVTSFVPLGGASRAGAETPPPTLARLAYDRDALYLAFECIEPRMGEVVARVVDHDGPAWMEDGVEVFLNPDGNRETYVQVVANTAGVLMDGIKRTPLAPLDMAWETGATTGVVRAEDRWSIELRIPFEGLPLGAPGAAWTFHLARNRRVAGQHLTSLAAPISGFHEIAKFDVLRGVLLAGRQVAVVDLHFGDGFQGTNLARVGLRNHGSEARTVQVELSGPEVGGGDIKRETAEVVLPAGAEGEVVVPWVIAREHAGSAVEVTVVVRDGDCVLRRARRRFEAIPSVFGDLPRRAFYRDRQEAVLIELPLRVGEASLRRHLTLEWQAFAADGSRVGSGMTTVRTQRAVIRLFWDAWFDGRYRLELTLREENLPLASWGTFLLLVENPWQE
ncbi:MAG: carbohydrate-binding family 9-like protein [Lentisphaeria bacterium]|nr:carbohydrate-binding family 9-like protein [Lentisphaeria bacterium]